MRNFTLVSYKIIRVDYNQFDKHFCLNYYICLCLKTKKQSLMEMKNNLSIIVHKLQSNMHWIVLLRKENLFHTSIQWESKQMSLGKKSRWGCTFFLSYLLIHKRNANVVGLTAFLQKLFRYCINEYFWNSPSKQVNSFVYLCRTFYGKWILRKNEKFLLTL